ncbi:hypothetical protein LNV09_00385 [Paucibacter sp. B2R-40]|nr:hypothetical protein [Paucibacter sp. B2R-40]
MHLSEPGVLLVAGVALSNLVSNVPAVMLLLPDLDRGLDAGKLLLVGSMPNLIVADLARQGGLVISARQHLHIGLPVMTGTLLLLWIWLS